MAFVLSNHEKGMIFKALEECLKSNSVEIAKSSLVVATWLVHMLYSFPDCGIRVVARKSLLDKFINVLQSSKNLEEKILATFALRGFISEAGWFRTDMTCLLNFEFDLVNFQNLLLTRLMQKVG